MWGCNIIVAIVITFGITFLTPLFFYVPQSTLAAIIVSGAGGLSTVGRTAAEVFNPAGA